jgi:hypothetical protein
MPDGRIGVGGAREQWGAIFAISPASSQPDTDAHALARFYGAVIQGTSVQARDGADRAALSEIVDIATAARPSGRATD